VRESQLPRAISRDTGSETSLNIGVQLPYVILSTERGAYPLAHSEHIMDWERGMQSDMAIHTARQSRNNNNNKSRQWKSQTSAPVNCQAFHYRQRQICDMIRCLPFGCRRLKAKMRRLLIRKREKPKKRRMEGSVRLFVHSSKTVDSKKKNGFH
jgi:hypothetical protein